MRWPCASLLAFATTALLVAAQSPSPSSSARAACAFTCHNVDLKGAEISFVTTDAEALVCSFVVNEVDRTCTYHSVTGSLINDNNDSACAPVAVRQCASKRFNIVQALAERRRLAAAARPQTSVPDLSKMRRRAALRRAK
ncbi:hypothetical protein EXIGLDRAFT_761348 [Exidia glandulosa HHB12029]|uniref:Hydrophobin n=1 Tax=Exidia glandulosa HHB12029 TaxID=1314781 RepID=A0A165NIF8_EXIGL|nr:hypothetical protein EXIGLDRAFT_761348 [Exidia glandulosa HHB12029]